MQLIDSAIDAHEATLGLEQTCKSALEGASQFNLVAGVRTKRLSPDPENQCDALVAGVGFERLSLVAVYDIPYQLKP